MVVKDGRTDGEEGRKGGRTERIERRDICYITVRKKRRKDGEERRKDGWRRRKGGRTEITERRDI